jgi:hypothetical protein
VLEVQQRPSHSDLPLEIELVKHCHEKVDAASMAMDRAVAGMLRQRPELVLVAQRNLERWIQQGEVASPHPAWLEWQELLARLRPGELADFLESDSPRANRLRQSSPFCGILSPTDRLAILEVCEEG